MKLLLPLLLSLFVAAAAQARTMRVLSTGYDDCRQCCGPAACGITASGKPTSAHGGKFVAADPKMFKFGKVVSVPGYGTVPVLDTGGAIKGRHIDLHFKSHAQARAWGKKYVTIRY